jgi:hypothetical protein
MHGFMDHDPADDARYERHPIQDIEPEPETEFTRLADMLSAVLVWLAENKTRNVSGLRNQSGTRRYFSSAKANLRMMAFLYAVRPDLVGHSLRAMPNVADAAMKPSANTLMIFGRDSISTRRSNGNRNRSRTCPRGQKCLAHFIFMLGFGGHRHVAKHRHRGAFD